MGWCRGVDIALWSEHFYEWTPDGVFDSIQRPLDLWFNYRGDCEDYAVLAGCVLATNTDRSLTLGFAGKEWQPPSHVVLSDGHDVYTSGVIFRDITLSEYIEYSDYDYVLPRRLGR